MISANVGMNSLAGDMANIKKAQTQTRRNKSTAKRPGASSTSAPHPMDIHVGSRVRLRRTLLGLSQEKLGDAVGLTFQQIQKYERGSNRMGASRLHEFSQILEVPVHFFFEGAPADSSLHRSQRPQSKNNKAIQEDYLQKRETLELVRAYYRIPDTLVRKRLFETIKVLAKSPS